MKRAVFSALTLLAAVAVAVAANLEELKPPKGTPVALVVFEDLECPDCARAHPLLLDASKQLNVPVVIHDYPLPSATPPFHAWAMDAAVMARYFEAKSPELGAEFRLYIFKSQPGIGNNPALFRAAAQRFADEHKLELPFVPDPKGELAAKINADKALGNRVGIVHTPTIFIATSKPGQPPVEVIDRSQLFKMVEDAKKSVAAAAPAPKTTVAHKKS